MSDPRWSKLLVVSIETWDDVWRRNQHVAARLVRLGYATSVDFVTPPGQGLALRARRWNPEPGIQVVTPPLLVPRRLGGHRAIGAWQRRKLRDVEAIWVNDPVAGAQLVSSDLPMLYDVTDDWRSMPQSNADRQRIVAAEDLLATRAKTVVCSAELGRRWRSRYDVEPILIPNGVDVGAIRSAEPVTLPGRAPHAVYVGTLHPNRIDVSLLLDLAAGWPGTLHLVGPLGLDPGTIDELRAADVELVGSVPSVDVPRWLASADVLVCPHLVNEFTSSLDAIKAHEYLATDRPIVATPSSGFQTLSAPGLIVADRAAFVAAVVDSAAVSYPRTASVDWNARASDFAGALASIT